MGLCGKLILLSGAVFAAFVGYTIVNLQNEASAPVLDKDFWWGPGTKRPDDATIRQFKIQVPDQVLIDLKARLTTFLQKSLQPPLEGIGFEYGFNSDYLPTVVKYWRDTYDWKAREKYLNSVPQYVTTVNGLKIHFLRVTPNLKEGKRILPLLLVHGWPGSVREFYEIIPLLTQPNDSTDFVFEVIIPSLPGYGWSEAAAKPGMGPVEIGVIFNNLMNKLGFQKYYVQGGDWGALVTRAMASLYPLNVLGAHSNMCGVNTPWAHFMTFVGSYFPSLVVEKENQHLMYPMSQKMFLILEESGYFHIQATKPDTIGTALSDTPAGLAAYILEKFSTWTNKAYRSLPDGGLTKKYSLENLLDNVMIYWVTNSITTSQRLYSEAFTFKQMAHQIDQVPVTVPSACARFHNELMWQPESLLKTQFKELVQLSDFKDGGHFAAFELPNELAKDIISAVSKMEKLRKDKARKIKLED